MSRKILRLPVAKHGVHSIVSRLLDNRVTVALAGAGGNGSQMLSGLARLHMALLKLGHPGGLHVTVFDPDFVSESNVGRQLFYPADIGSPKAFCLVNRYNLGFNFDWGSVPDKFDLRMTATPGYHSIPLYDIVISCVDTAEARRSIHEQLSDAGQRSPAYWLDLGNTQRNGQVILGQPRNSQKIGLAAAEELRRKGVWDIDAEIDKLRLPCVTDVFPELLDASIPEDNAPSCSLAEALQKQDLFINQHVASWALQLLWKLFREGKINQHGAFINLESGRVNPLLVPAHIGAAKPKKERKAA